MKIGDLVQFIDNNNTCDGDGRNVGTVLKFDQYHQPNNGDALTLGEGEAIVEILWGSGEVGWILKTRVKVVA